MSQIVRLRKHLAEPVASPAWPADCQRIPLGQTDPDALHAILDDAYANGFGSVPPFEDWWRNLTADTEFDPALVFIAADASGQPIGVAQCWTVGFVKDLAVVPAWRGKGVGDALLGEIFAVFQRRGLRHVDLKVVAANASAIGLYRRAGMIEAPL
jgi:ribosomal protein S18 acetylase RimI-like enzyme